ncbi:MAG TPA: hypothetical protein VNS32_05940, partial [Flavisolibacter sp.]|nr:hypothetical protein [Flavisolibacter sp.]
MLLSNTLSKLRLYTTYLSKRTYKHLPRFSQFLLTHHLEALVSEEIQLYFEVDLPLLKYLKHYSAEQLFTINLASVTQFLETLSQGREQKLIETALEQLERDQLQVIGQRSMTGEDITLMHYVRARSLRKYIPFFTQDVTNALELTDEMEGFLAGWTTASVNSYIQNITERKLPELELLEKTRALERSNQSLEQFAYAASHDLK